MRDVVVVGAGISGCSLAAIVGKVGYDVLVVDAKPHFIPKVCSGLISRRIDSLLRYPKSAVLNEVKGAIFHAGSFSLELKRKSPQAYVMDRDVLDLHVLRQAEKYASFEFGSRFLGFKRKGKHVICMVSKKGEVKRVEARVVVGADGTLSTMRKLLGLGRNLWIINSALTYVRDEIDGDVVEIYYDKEIADGFFAWRIPRKDSFVEYGLGCRKGNAVEKLVEFCRRFGKKVSVKDVKAGFIPLGLIDRSCDDNVILVGDAASQVKPFSGGGVIYSLICAKIGGEAIIRALQSGDYGKEFFLKNYENVWKKRIGTKIRVGMMIRRLFDSFSDEELEEMFRMIDENKDLFLKFADMDFLGNEVR